MSAMTRTRASEPLMRRRILALVWAVSAGGLLATAAQAHSDGRPWSVVGWGLLSFVYAGVAVLNLFADD